MVALGSLAWAGVAAASTMLAARAMRAKGFMVGLRVIRFRADAGRKPGSGGVIGGPGP